ncbi:hypothetical protein HYN43_010340 [Mucilaginibacter celer]|uniref:Uncharacterized protein n=1 Tax=Mucilaginibacter celer TaxID=2305508 RepID=A0A494VXE3_9SPHI|nr:hypothetical protein HYN43_010340 [Mucilaginibacter celer]
MALFNSNESLASSSVEAIAVNLRNYFSVKVLKSPLERGRDGNEREQGCVIQAINRMQNNTPLHPSQERNRTFPMLFNGFPLKLTAMA